LFSTKRFMRALNRTNRDLNEKNTKSTVTKDLLGSYILQKHAFSLRLHSDQMHTGKDQQAYLKRPNKNKTNTLSRSCQLTTQFNQTNPCLSIQSFCENNSEFLTKNPRTSMISVVYKNMIIGATIHNFPTPTCKS
jgi:hypothetical protein